MLINWTEGTNCKLTCMNGGMELWQGSSWYLLLDLYISTRFLIHCYPWNLCICQYAVKKIFYSQKIEENLLGKAHILVLLLIIIFNSLIMVYIYERTIIIWVVRFLFEKMLLKIYQLVWKKVSKIQPYQICGNSKHELSEKSRN